MAEPTKADADRSFQAGLEKYNGKEYEQSIALFQEALQIYQTLAARAEERRTFIAIGLAYSYIDSSNRAADESRALLEESLENLTKALETIDPQDENPLEQKATLLNYIGIVQDKLGNFPDALENYYLSLNLFEQMNDAVGSSRILNNIGLTYYHIGDAKLSEGDQDESSILVRPFFYTALDYCYRAALVFKANQSISPDEKATLENIRLIARLLLGVIELTSDPGTERPVPPVPV